MSRECNKSKSTYILQISGSESDYAPSLCSTHTSFPLFFITKKYKNGDPAFRGGQVEALRYAKICEFPLNDFFITKSLFDCLLSTNTSSLLFKKEKPRKI